MSHAHRLEYLRLISSKSMLTRASNNPDCRQLGFIATFCDCLQDVQSTNSGSPWPTVHFGIARGDFPHAWSNGQPTGVPRSGLCLTGMGLRTSERQCSEVFGEGFFGCGAAAKRSHTHAHTHSLACGFRRFFSLVVLPEHGYESNEFKSGLIGEHTLQGE